MKLKSNLINLFFVTLRLAGLDDCNILHLEHLDGNILERMHDSINVQNLRLHGFACTSSQAMSHVTK
jgi:hypothetical protein